MNMYGEVELALSRRQFQDPFGHQLVEGGCDPPMVVPGR